MTTTFGELLSGSLPSIMVDDSHTSPEPGYSLGPVHPELVSATILTELNLQVSNLTTLAEHKLIYTCPHLCLMSEIYEILMGCTNFQPSKIYN